MDPLNQSPIASGSQIPPTPEPPKSTVGPIAGTIIIILLLIAGGLYFWGAQLNRQSEPLPFIPSNDLPPAPPPQGMGDPVSGLPPQAASDDAASIEADLNAMDLNQFESQNSAELDNF